MELVQQTWDVESNVQVVLWNQENQRGEVHSFWECDMTRKELLQFAVGTSVRFSELCGSGHTQFQIIGITLEEQEKLDSLGAD